MDSARLPSDWPVLPYGAGMARILLAEDDPTLADVLRRHLERDAHEVIVVTSAREAVIQTRRQRPDLVLLDVALPTVDGVHVCRLLRAGPDLPVLVVAAEGADSVRDLDLDPDDLVTTPCTPREIVARIRIALRQHAAPASGQHRVGDLLVDTVRHEVWVGGRPVTCSPAEFAILECLAARPGQAFRRGALLDHVFGADHGALERTVDVHVMNLRRKLEPDPGTPTRLLTVYGVGYTLATPVQPEAPDLTA